MSIKYPPNHRSLIWHNIVSGNLNGAQFKILTGIELSGNRDASYDHFLRDLMGCGPEDCRYGLFDFEYEHQCQGTSERTKKEKLLLMSW